MNTVHGISSRFRERYAHLHVGYAPGWGWCIYDMGTERGTATWEMVVDWGFATEADASAAKKRLQEIAQESPA